MQHDQANVHDEETEELILNDDVFSLNDSTFEDYWNNGKRN